MSYIPAPGVVSCSYWSYTAIVTANFLKSVFENRSLLIRIPKGIKTNAIELINLVLEGAGNSLSINPPACLHVMMIMWDICMYVGICCADIKDLHSRFTRYYDLLIILDTTERDVTSEELIILQELRAILLRLYNLGEAEAYEEVMGHPQGS